MAEVLAVTADPAALQHPVGLRQRERGLGDDASDRLEPLRLQACRISRATSLLVSTNDGCSRVWIWSRGKASGTVMSAVFRVGALLS